MAQFSEGLNILGEAVREVVQHRWPLLKVLAAPVAGSTLAIMIPEWLPPSTTINIVFIVIGFAFYAMFAVSCHRLILIGQDSLPNEHGVYFTFRELRFLGWMLALILLYIIMTIPIGLVFGALAVGLNLADGRMLFYIGAVLTSYFEGRLGMVFPATATDSRFSLERSWQITRGRGLAIMLALLIPSIAISLVQFASGLALTDRNSVFAQIVDSILIYPIVAVSVAVLSVTYRRVTAVEDL